MASWKPISSVGSSGRPTAETPATSAAAPAPPGARPLVAAAIALVAALPFVAGCKNTCADVACAPAPPAIMVTVYDTLRVDTTLTIPTSNPDSSTTLDTTITVTRPTIMAMVQVVTISGADTAAIDTLAPRDMKFYRDDAAGLPLGTFALIARRGERRVVQTGLTVRQVEGCCAYSVVGVYTMYLQ